MPDPLMPAFHW